MIATNGRAIVVVAQAFAIASAEQHVALCAAALGTDRGGLRRVLARGDGGRRCGVRYPEDRCESCFGGSVGRHS
jgi:hypothetical protein